MLLFPSVVHVFRIAQKLQNPNLHCRYGHQDNSECEIVSEETSFLLLLLFFVCLFVFFFVFFVVVFFLGVVITVFLSTEEMDSVLLL